MTEEYGMTIELRDEKYTSLKCPLHESIECGARIKRGFFKCTLSSKVFNADLVAAYNILKRKTHNPKPRAMRGRGNAPETGRGTKPGRSPV